MSRPYFLAIGAAVLMSSFGCEKTKPTSPKTDGGREIPIESIEIKIDDGAVHGLAAGKHDAMPVVLLHGARFSAETWRKLGTIAVLAEAGYRAVAIDVPGYGRSPKSPVDPRTWLARVLGELSERKAVVVSPSMSGQLSLPLATGQPEKLAGFVPVAPVAVPAYKDRLAKVAVPTLVVWGASDRVVPLAHADLLASTIPGAKKLILPGAQHPCYLDAPEAFHKALLEFLAGLTVGGTR